MKVLITGSSGSFGTLLVKNLINRNIPVVGMDIRDLDGNEQGEYFKFHRSSITDKKSLRNIFNAEKPDRVIHFACTFNRVRNLQKEYENDVIGSKNILEICHETTSVKQLVFSSSALAYGGNQDNPSWLKETDPLRPGNLRYGLNKKTIERIYTERKVRDDLNVSIIRVCTVVGPEFSKPASVVYILLKWSWLPEFCKENRLQFLHIEDFLSIINNIIDDDSVNGIFNVAPDSYSVVKDILPWKRFYKFPVSVVKSFLGILYGFRILNLQPSGINSSIHPIVLDPAKLVSRYNYKFRFTSDQAFSEAGINGSIDRRRNMRLD